MGARKNEDRVSVEVIVVGIAREVDDIDEDVKVGPRAADVAVVGRRAGLSAQGRTTVSTGQELFATAVADRGCARGCADEGALVKVRAMSCAWKQARVAGHEAGVWAGAVVAGLQTWEATGGTGEGGVVGAGAEMTAEENCIAKSRGLRHGDMGKAR